MVLKKILIIFISFFLLGCSASMPEKTFGNENEVSIKFYSTKMLPAITREARQMAESHCNEFGRTAVYAGTARISLWDTSEEYDFKCVESSYVQKRQKKSTGSAFLISTDVVLILFW